MLKRFLKNESGATAVAFAIAAPVFIGGITLAVELGHWHQKKSKMQDMADHSAVAAAQEIMLIGEKAKYELAGKGHAFENGFKFSPTNNVVVNSPPIGDKYADRDDMVEVVMKRKQDLYFSQILGGKSFDMETRAIAIVLEGVPACILSLSPTAGPAFSVSGSATIDVAGCSVHTNSNATNSVEISDKENFTADCLSSAGGIDAGTSYTLTECTRYKEYSRTLKDPYADVSVPSNVSSMPCLKPTKVNKWDKAITPGRYCDTVSASGAIYLSDPGTYYFDGADLVTKSQYAWVRGRDVTIVFMNGGLFHNANGGLIDVTAPSTGDFAGLAFYFDPVSTPPNYLKINGNQHSTIEGVFYAPTLNLQFNGGGSTSSQCTHIVANTVELTGNATFRNDQCESKGVKQIGGESGVALVE